jgi:hypothetical protein
MSKPLKPGSQTITKGYGEIIAVEPSRAWFEPRTGGRLVFSIAVWQGGTPPVLNDRIAWRQLGDRVVAVKRISQ